MTPKVQVIKDKIGWTSSTLKTSVLQQTWPQLEKKTPEWEKMFAIVSLIRDLYPEYKCAYKSLIEDK